MEKNYYEWLEINEKASPEIVEKAYKTLAKKYHPDLQEEAHKKEAEEKFKKINDAYQILSDSIKRENYDQKLEMARKQELNSKINNANIVNNNKTQYNPDYNYNNNIQTVVNKQNYEEIEKRKIKTPQTNISQQEYERQMNEAIKKAYEDAYVKDLQMRGYRVRQKKTVKDYLKSFLAIAVTTIIIILIFQIPFVKNYFISFYENNIIVKQVVDIIINIFQ